MTKTTQRVYISDVFALQMGKTPPRKNMEYWNSGSIDWLSIADLSNCGKYASISKERITPAAIEKCRMQAVPANTLVMSFKLSIGKTAITARPIYTNEAIMAFIDKGTYVFSLDYLYHQFKSREWSQDINVAVMGATLNKKTLSEQEIVLPPLEEQQRIANRLDEIERLQRIAQDMLDKYDELIQSRFVEMFEQDHPYDFVPMSSIGTVQTGATPSRKNREYYNGDIPWIKTNQIKYSTITSTDEHITKKALQNTNCKLLPVGTVLIAMYGQGDTRGRAAIVGVPAATNQASASIVLEKECCNSLFLLVQLKLRYEELRSLSQGGTQKNLSLGIIKEFPVMVPPIEIQNDFAAFVEQVNQMKDETTRTLEQLQMLYDSLAQEYFAI